MMERGKQVDSICTIVSSDSKLLSKEKVGLF